MTTAHSATPAPPPPAYTYVPASQLPTPLRTMPAAFLPSADTCEAIARRVAIHLRNGHWEQAITSLESARRDHDEYIADRKLIHSLPLTERAQLPLVMLDLSIRETNCLESVGCNTIADAAEVVNSGEWPDNFGYTAANCFWKAMKEIGLDTYRRPIKSPATSKHTSPNTIAARDKYLDDSARAEAEARKAAGRELFQNPVDYSKVHGRHGGE